MSLCTLILEESRRFKAAYGQNPCNVFIGTKQSAEIDDMIAGIIKVGLWVQGKPTPRARICDLWVFKVDADDHLSFGVEQPSPCG